MHFVLHDWPDDDCTRILQNIKAAMAPGYSVLILNEAVLPDLHCSTWFAANDISMMANAAGITRSQSQWKDLIESAGMRIRQIWMSPAPDDNEGIIEIAM